MRVIISDAFTQESRLQYANGDAPDCFTKREKN
jgi:hypothetical protein